MKSLIALILSLVISAIGVIPVSAQEEIPQQQFYEAIVVSILDESPVGEEDRYTQTIEVTVVGGELAGKTITIDRGYIESVFAEQLYQPGDRVIVSSLSLPGEAVQYNLADTYRLPALAWLAIAYAVAVLIVGRGKGLRSIIGLILSFGVLMVFIIPQILAGHSPLLITVIGAAGISVLAILVTHGINPQSLVSFMGTILALVFTGILAMIYTQFAHLTGFGSEEANFLQSGAFHVSSMRGLLLSGIIIGALGVIDDMAVTQASIIFELHKTNPKLSISDLYQKGLNIGKDHIASITNTLVLAYAGASLPLFLLLYQNEFIPQWVALNSEIIAEEVVSTLVGSLGLVMAVPVTTLIAAVVVKKRLLTRQ